MKENKKIVWVNGCFDILHRGHVELLEYAKSCGDELVVGIDFDARVKAAKGPSRPFNTFEDRKRVLESLRAVDRVVGFGSDQELVEQIKSIKPFYMVVGSDWEGKKFTGHDIDGELYFHKRDHDWSTTAFRNRLKNS